ncbi:hypothetical protein C0995_016188 [Termitomyces sp. Mi166|nr:hypothetical protein C0995_016188 [Termitomyces sp. Mi166\
MSSFFMNKKYYPWLTVFLCNISSHIAHKATYDLQSLQEYLQTEIVTANKVYSKHADSNSGMGPQTTPGNSLTTLKELLTCSETFTVPFTNVLGFHHSWDGSTRDNLEMRELDMFPIPALKQTASTTCVLRVLTLARE